MGDFIKIFISVMALVSAFLFGRNYGEKAYLDSTDYKAIIAARQELDYAKAELEDTKAKLQNIMDRAETQKTDELLSQLMNVFLVDLGLRVQNKELILKNAQMTAANPAPILALKPAIEKIKQDVATEEKNNAKEQEKISAAQSKAHRQFKTYEWMLSQSGGGSETLRSLDKVVIKNLNAYLSAAGTEKVECESLLGAYSGGVKDINNRDFGSMKFDLKQAADKAGNPTDGYQGKIAWYNDPNAPLTQQINNTCGRKVKGTDGRIFSLADDRYVQIYQLTNTKTIAGNFYEVLPGGTTKRLGKFELRPVGRF